MENKKPFDQLYDPHKKAQDAIDHAREVREGKLAGLGKRRLRVVRESPLLGVCEYCNMQFSSGESQLAKSDIQVQFNEHKCKRQDVNQAAARIVRETTERS